MSGEDSERVRREAQQRTGRPFVVVTPAACERCHARPRRFLLGKGIWVCGGCYRPPEDIARDLGRR